MTRYADFERLKELTALTKVDKGYSKFIQTGELDHYDYGRGFIDLDIYVYQSPMDNIPRIRIWFGTIDDGDFGGWRECETVAEAEMIVDQIATNIFKDMVSFPSNDKLNELLRPYGIYVTYE